MNSESFLVENPDGSLEEIGFDYGFICLGMRSKDEHLKEINEYARENAIEIVNIGDSDRVRRIIDGVREGRNIVRKLETMGKIK